MSLDSDIDANVRWVAYCLAFSLYLVSTFRPFTEVDAKSRPPLEKFLRSKKPLAGRTFGIFYRRIPLGRTFSPGSSLASFRATRSPGAGKYAVAS